MWRTYRTLRSASCVDGLAVRAAVWRWRGARRICRASRAGGRQVAGPVALSQNRTNSRLNYIAIIAEPSRRVWHSDGDAVTLTGPAGRSRGRRDRRTRPGAAKLNAHSALATAPGRRVLRGGVARNCRNGAIGELRHQCGPARMNTNSLFGIAALRSLTWTTCGRRARRAEYRSLALLWRVVR